MPYSQARNVLFNYIAKIETMELLIAKESEDLTVKQVEKQAKRCKKFDQNCKHACQKHHFHKFQTKLLQDVALGSTE